MKFHPLLSETNWNKGRHFNVISCYICSIKLSKDRLTCRQRVRLCVLSRWSPHTQAWHPPMSHSAARCQMHLGYGSGDCSIAGCTVESPWLLSTLVQHTDAHLSVLHLELSVSYETLCIFQFYLIMFLLLLSYVMHY